MKKKLMSILLALVLFLSSFAFSPSAFANSYELIPDVRQTVIINGYGDLAWLYYTPDQSGLYNIMSMNVNKSVCYLTVRETNEETGMEEIKTLAYAGEFSDPNYKENEHNEFQFSLTYHLEKGVTYWFAVGWKPPTYTKQQFNVIFRLKSLDENPIESVELTNVPDLVAYDGGEIRTDANGKNYYHYLISKIQTNAAITLHYKDGTSSAPTRGKAAVDGFYVKWIDDQYYNHWYPDADPEHTQNLIKVSVLGVEASWDVKLNIGERTYITGKVINLADQPVEGADIKYDGAVKARTDSNGEFKFYAAAGAKNLSITTSSVIEYKKVIVVPVTSVGMPYTTYKICNCDFVKDGYINAKDFSYIKNKFTGDEYEKRTAEFRASINFTKDKYNQL